MAGPCRRQMSLLKVPSLGACWPQRQAWLGVVLALLGSQESFFPLWGRVFASVKWANTYPGGLV